MNQISSKTETFDYQKAFATMDRTDVNNKIVCDGVEIYFNLVDEDKGTFTFDCIGYNKTIALIKINASGMTWEFIDEKEDHALGKAFESIASGVFPDQLKFVDELFNIDTSRQYDREIVVSEDDFAITRISFGDPPKTAEEDVAFTDIFQTLTDYLDIDYHGWSILTYQSKHIEAAWSYYDNDEYGELLKFVVFGDKYWDFDILEDVKILDVEVFEDRIVFKNRLWRDDGRYVRGNLTVRMEECE